MNRKIIWLTIFAVAMAFLEAAVVIYLRQLYYPGNILQIFPVRLVSDLDYLVELGREIATLIMMLSLAFLIEKNPTRIFAAFVYQFGIWDLFYYIWLKFTIGWPLHFFEWDVLFLIPWIWLGPWLCPVLISLLFIIWGIKCLHGPQDVSISRKNLLLFITGSVLALISFLQPAFGILLQGGINAITTYVPQDFWWWLFLPGYFLMAAGLFSQGSPTGK